MIKWVFNLILLLSLFFIFGSLSISAEQVKKPEPSQSLQEQATDPTAILTQLQVQNVLVPKTHDASGYANQFILQPVIPISKNKIFPMTQVIRSTLPLLTTADPSGPVDDTTSLGDLVVLDIFLPERKDWGIWGVGPIAIFPTATDDRIGQGKWQLGPAFIVFYNKIKHWQLGLFVQNPISIAGDNNRPDVSTLILQPIATRHLNKGWYVGIGDLQTTYEWHSGNYNIPINFRVGKVGKLFEQNVNLFLEPFYTPHGFQSGGQAEWGFKLNMTFLFPKVKF